MSLKGLCLRLSPLGWILPDCWLFKTEDKICNCCEFVSLNASCIVCNLQKASLLVSVGVAKGLGHQETVMMIYYCIRHLSAFHIGVTLVYHIYCG